MNQPHLQTYIMVFVIAALFVWRNLRPRKLGVGTLWILPSVLLVLSALSIWASYAAAEETQAAVPPMWMTAVAAMAGLAAGIPFGVLRGRHSKVKQSERRDAMIVEPSAVVILIWLGAFAARLGLRAVLPHAGAAATALTDALLLFATSSVAGMRYELYRKFKALHVTSANVSESA